MLSFGLNQAKRKGLSEKSIFAIIVLLIFAFLIAYSLINAGDSASSLSPIVAKYKAYFTCKNAGYDGGKISACAKAIFGVA